MFDYNLNKKCLITIIFGTLITQTTIHQKVVSLSPHLLVQLSYLGKLSNPENHEFSQKRNRIL